MTPVLAVVLLALGCWFAAGPLLAARTSSLAPAGGRRRRERRTGGAPDRTTLALSLLTALLGVVLARFLVPWASVPPVLWALPVALCAAGVLAAARRWPALPVLASPRPRLRVVGAGVDVVVSIALLAAIIGW